jgi:predicted nuclease with RNAse H fold
MLKLLLLSRQLVVAAVPKQRHRLHLHQLQHREANGQLLRTANRLMPSPMMKMKILMRRVMTIRTVMMTMTVMTR